MGNTVEGTQLNNKESVKNEECESITTRYTKSEPKSVKISSNGARDGFRNIKVISKNKKSYILIKNGKMYILSTNRKDYSSCAIPIIPGFQIELGRNIKEIEEAIKFTRLPVIIKELVERGSIKQLQIIRMQTGKVNDKVVASIVCNKDIITSISFNRALINDNEYRKYNGLTVLHQISIPFELCDSNATSRRDQVNNLLSNILPHMGLTDISVAEDKSKLCAIAKNKDGDMLKFTFIFNKNTSRFEFTSISL